MSDIRTLASRIPFWIQVTRLDRPVGWIVLLWPTWIALTLAGFKADSFDLGYLGHFHPWGRDHSKRRLCGE